MAALKGIDIDKGNHDTEDRFEAVQRRVESRLTGKSEQELEYSSFGIDVEIEE